MQTELHILVCHDDPAMLEHLQQSLAFLRSHFQLQLAPSGKEAMQQVHALQQQSAQLAMILCSDNLPAAQGVELLVSLHQDPATADARKVLVCHELEAERIVRAVNHGGLDHCLLYPWQEADLAQITMNLLTEYVIRHCEHPLRFAMVLDERQILEHLRHHTPTHLDFR